MTVRFRMVAHDYNSNPTQYRHWVVNNAPDLTGIFYDGYKSGKNALGVVSTYEINDGYAVVDFHLPLPTKFFQTRLTLPDTANNSQLVVLDGYAWIFGGDGSNKILQASVNNPATFIDTGRTIPDSIGGASLAIVNGRIYLFGGSDGYGPTNAIYSASVADPLTWRTESGTLPQALSNASLMMNNGQLLIYGGKQGNTALNTIYSASTANPLIWTLDGYLPTPLYSSTTALIDGYVWLFAGLNAVNNPTSNIYSAPITSPNNFTLDGYLPYQCYSGKFFTVGNEGYLIANTGNPITPNTTPILQCELSDPTTWVDIANIFPTDPLRSFPGSLSHFQLMIVYDRIWVLGGSTNAIFTCEQNIAFNYLDSAPMAYGAVTRTLFQATNNLTNPFTALCFPYWVTSY